MAFDWLATPGNEISVIEVIKDRDEDVVCELTIGHGYGIFRGQNQVEYVGQSSAQFSHIGILVFYEPAVSTVEVDGTTYASSHVHPRIGDVCIWHGVRYDITAVDPHPDVNGDLVGYTVRCSSGANR